MSAFTITLRIFPSDEFIQVQFTYDAVPSNGMEFYPGRRDTIVC